MNKDQLIAWLNENDIALAERVPQEGGEVLIFMGSRPFPWAGGPRWASIAIKDGQTRVATKEIEALLRHFCQGQLVIPRGSRAAAAGSQIAVQPIHSEQPQAKPAAPPKSNLEN